MIAMYAIWDRKALAYRAPWPSSSRPVAIRNFTYLVKVDETLHDFPEDFELHAVGYWDQEKGSLWSEGPPEIVIHGALVGASLKES